ncbi:U4/U6-U5 snRNP complex subunit LSM8 [Sporothrix epigloea]|uniref:LSM2-LSM8 complex subunit LSM8 n=1 Tax=Sporothrix epigloea TaxID=1892477 RepID=A0ABP0DJ96_9PEZI
MAALLNNYLEKKVLVLTVDSRILVGKLVSIDNSTNLVLVGTVERVINTPDDDEPSAEVPLGLYLVRGDNVCSIGLVDEQLDASIDWTKVRGQVIGTTKHI